MNGLEVTANLIESVLETQFFIRYFGCKEAKKLKYVFAIMVAMQFVAVEISNCISYSSELQMFVILPLRFILVICLLQGRILEKFFITQVDIMILQTISIILTSAFDSVVQYDVAGYMEFGLWRIGLLVLSKILFLVVTEFILSHKIQDKEYISNKIYAELNIVVLALILAFNLLMAFTYQNARDNQVIQEARLLLFFLIIVNIMVYLLFVNLTNNSIRLLKEQMKVAAYEQKVKDMQTLQESQQQVRKLNHDINRKLSNLRIMILTGQNEKAENYLNELLKESTSIKKVITTENVLIDAVLNHHLEICEMKKIETKIQMECSVHPKMETDVAVMLSNLLENAVEAAEKTQERMIETWISNKGDYVAVSVSNSYDGILEKKGNHILSTKEDKKTHGYGLINIRDIVKKYDGIYEYHIEEEKFVTKILLVQFTD